MHGTRTNARRRANASASSTASTKTDGSNDNGSINSAVSNGHEKSGGGGRRRKSQPKTNAHLGRYVRRKGKNISRMKQMCSKIGKLRVIDVVLCIGVAVKLASMLYSRRQSMSSTSNTPVQPDPPKSMEPESTTDDKEALSDKIRKSLARKQWIKRWAENKMPFHSPLLYQREDDDYSFGYDSYPNDDDADDDISMQRKNLRQSKQQTRFKGMFPNEYPFEDHKEDLNGQGYVVVDDVLYHADEYRESTDWAIDHSEFLLNDPSVYDGFEFLLLAFELRNDEAKHLGHFTDDDHWDNYYAFDDDIVRGTLGMGDDENTNSTSGEDVCTPPSFYRTYKPNCNEFHASMSGYQWFLGEEIFARRWKKNKHLAAEKKHLSKYLGHGYYRDAFKFQSLFVSNDEKGKHSTQWDEVVFKTMRHMYKSEKKKAGVEDDEIEREEHETESLGFEFDPDDKYTFLQYQEDMRKDAMVMELLTSSPRATNIYAHCSMSSVIEFAPINLEDYILPSMGYPPKKILRGVAGDHEQDGPVNDHISPEEKLEIALEMAKCLATMHGYKDGVIAHVDLQVGQFFRGRDGLIKIVDYNRAEPLLYDTKKGEYCKWCNGQPADGVYRSPEENVDDPLTEKIDVYSLGNVFYSVLTGKLVWVETDYDEYHQAIVDGETLIIPEYEENEASRHLSLAIRACWSYHIEDRPTIFEVVEFLENAVAASKKKDSREQSYFGRVMG